MATQVQRRRGTASEHNTFTGAAGEVTVNTTNESLHVHDGATAGGFEAMRADANNAQDDVITNAMLSLNANDGEIKKAVNSNSNPPIYAARAWVNFNGKNGSIANDGNVSSVTRNSLGEYTINFATNMPNTQYATYGFSSKASTEGNTRTMSVFEDTGYGTGSVRVQWTQGTNNREDPEIGSVLIFSD